MAVDGDGAFIGNAWTWMDTRAQKEAGEIEAELGNEYVYGVTGWKISPALDIAKLRHMKKQDDFENTNAAIRQLYHVEKNCWDDRILAMACITKNELPPVLPTGAKVGNLTKEASQEMGLPEGVSVFNGAHDQYCASLGAGAVQEGDMLLSAGTTWVLMGIGKEPLFTDSYIAPGKHPVEGLYGAIASLICSGASMQWYKDGFLSVDFQKMNEEVEKRQEKCKGVFFYPYLAGAGYPVWNLQAKGAFVGLSLEHDKYDFARAIMEGVAFGVCRGIEDFRKNNCDIKKIVMMGGASKSALWCQMVADITAIPILRLNQADVCAMGAAMIAACGLEWFENYNRAAEAMVRVEKIYEPCRKDVLFYNDKFAEYDKMWSLMQKYYEK